jgi:hypothetical protein
MAHGSKRFALAVKDVMARAKHAAPRLVKNNLLRCANRSDPQYPSRLHPRYHRPRFHYRHLRLRPMNLSRRATELHPVHAGRKTSGN